MYLLYCVFAFVVGMLFLIIANTSVFGLCMEIKGSISSVSV